jgi:parvulin-like peptidyl-prolyl isomerase
MKGFPWRFALYFIGAVYLFADLYACRGPLARRFAITGGGDGPDAVAARVYGRAITRLELEEAMRDHLFRRGETWDALGESAKKQTRWLVLESLVNARLVTAFRMMNGLDSTPRADVADGQMKTFRRQFESEESYQSRLGFRHMSEKTFREKLAAFIEDEQWIEERIRERVEEVTDTQAREWFQANADAMKIPEAWRAAHLFLTRHEKKKPDREAEIREMHRQITAGEKTFDELVAKNSEDERTKTRGGDLGWFTHERMPPEIITTLKRLTSGKISAPVLTSLGWHIVKLIETKQERAPSFEEVRAEVISHLRNERREAAVKALVAELRMRSMQPKSFVFYFPEVVDEVSPAPMEK